jgi:hypothetical protein
LQQFQQPGIIQSALRKSNSKPINLSARPKPAKETKLDDCLADLQQPSNFKIVQVKHLRCCYNILAALQESFMIAIHCFLSSASRLSSAAWEVVCESEAG